MSIISVIIRMSISSKREIGKFIFALILILPSVTLISLVPDWMLKEYYFGAKSGFLYAGGIILISTYFLYKSPQLINKSQS